MDGGSEDQHSVSVTPPDQEAPPVSPQSERASWHSRPVYTRPSTPERNVGLFPTADMCSWPVV